jgi:PAS domain S-box-containing protein
LPNGREEEEMTPMNMQENASRFSASDAIEELPLPYMELNSEGRILYANQEMREILSARMGVIVGSMISDGMPADESADFATFLASAMQEKRDIPNVIKTIYSAKNGYSTCEFHLKQICDIAGTPIGMRVVCVDVTEIMNRLEEEQSASKWERVLLESVSDAVIVTDTMGQIQRFNPAAEALFGWKVTEVVGQMIDLVINVDEIEVELGFNRSIALEIPTEGIVTATNRLGRQMKLNVHTSPIVDRVSCATLGIVGIVREIP